MEFAYFVLGEFHELTNEISELLLSFRVKKASSLNKKVLLDDDVLLRSGTNPYIEQGLLVQDSEKSDHDKDRNLSQVEFAALARATPRWERKLFYWTVADFS